MHLFYEYIRCYCEFIHHSSENDTSIGYTVKQATRCAVVVPSSTVVTTTAAITATASTTTTPLSSPPSPSVPPSSPLPTYSYPLSALSDGSAVTVPIIAEGEKRLGITRTSSECSSHNQYHRSPGPDDRCRERRSRLDH